MLRPDACLFSVVLLGALPALAQSAAPAPPAPPSADEPTAVPVLVLPIQAKTGVEPGVTELLEDKITVELSDYPDFSVLARSDVEQMLELEAERSALGCDLESNSCLAEVAGAMGAQYVVFGRMGKLGSKFSLTLSLYDSHKAANVSRVNVDDDALDRIADAVPSMVAELVTPLLSEAGLRGKAGAMALAAAPAPAPTAAAAAKPAANAPAEPTTTAPAEAESGVSEAEDGLGVVWWLVPVAVGVVGGAIFAGGLVADFGICASFGCNGEPGAEDLIGPGIMLAGVGVLGAGAATAVVFLFL